VKTVLQSTVAVGVKAPKNVFLATVKALEALLPIVPNGSSNLA